MAFAILLVFTLWGFACYCWFTMVWWLYMCLMAHSMVWLTPFDAVCVVLGVLGLFNRITAKE